MTSHSPAQPLTTPGQRLTTPEQPLTAPAQRLTACDQATGVLAPPATGETLDALPLLDARLLARTIAPELAGRGHYLAFCDDSETRLLRLDEEIIHLGRGGPAQIRFDDHHVSRDHAILVRHGDHLRLLDNRSSNGTFVNGRRISATNLSSGDAIDLGPVRMHLLEVR
jgi:hypothetical protein